MEDLTHLCKGLTGGASMSAGNGISSNEFNTTGAPGSVSEQVVVTLATPNAVEGDSNPDLPAVHDYAKKVK